MNSYRFYMPWLIRGFGTSKPLARHLSAVLRLSGQATGHIFQPRVITAAAAAVCAGLGSLPAAADEADVFNITLGQSTQYDDNVFRLDDETDAQAVLGTDERSDFVTSTFVVIDFNKRVSRQLFTANLNQSFIKFDRFDQLDYRGQDFKASWSGESGADNRYGLDYTRNRTLSNFADLQVPRNNVRTRDNLRASLRWRVQGDWVATASSGTVRQRNSNEIEQANDLQTRYGSVGLRYDPGSGNYVELMLRRSNTDYDSDEITSLRDNAFRQNEVALAFRWAPSGVGRWDAEIALQSRKHENLGSRDFTQPAGFIEYLWRPSGVTSLSVRAYREVGAVGDNSGFYAETDGLTVSPTWTPTGKLQFEAQLEVSRRKYFGEQIFSFRNPITGQIDTLSESSDREDDVHALSLTATYVAWRNLLLAATLRNEERDSTQVLRDYSTRSASFTAQYTF